MLEKHCENRKYLEAIIDVAVTVGYLIAVKKIEVGDSRELIDAVIEIAESFESKFKDFNWNDQPADDSFKSYITEVDNFSEEQLLERYGVAEEMPITPIQTTVEARVAYLGKLRAMQAFISELSSLDLTKEDALQRLTQREFDTETLEMTQMAVEKYFEGIESYRVYERSFFLKKITKKEAESLFAAEVYELYDDGTEGFIFSRNQLNNAKVYGVSMWSDRNSREAILLLSSCKKDKREELNK